MDWSDRIEWLLWRAYYSKGTGNAHGHVGRALDQLHSPIVTAEPCGKEALDLANIALVLRPAKGKGNTRFNRAVAAAIAECEAEQARRDADPWDLSRVDRERMVADPKARYGFSSRQRPAKAV